MMDRIRAHRSLLGSTTAALGVAAALVCVTGTTTTSSGAQYAAQRALQEYLVTFEFEQENDTTDQVTILFTNEPAPGKGAPFPVFGPDIVEEFSFSGGDFPKAKGNVRFSRRIRDVAFLDCRYIRVVNHGTNRWFPTTISLAVNNGPILSRVSMYPRQGKDPKGGIERWNRQWNAVFWQGELQRFRPRMAK